MWNSLKNSNKLVLYEPLKFIQGVQTFAYALYPICDTSITDTDPTFTRFQDALPFQNSNNAFLLRINWLEWNIHHSSSVQSLIAEIPVCPVLHMWFYSVYISCVLFCQQNALCDAPCTSCGNTIASCTTKSFLSAFLHNPLHQVLRLSKV